MKSILISALTALAILATNSAQAATPKIECSLTLLSPVPWAPSHFYIPPMTGVYNFTYVPGTEKTFKIGVENLLPGGSDPQYKLITAKSDEDSVLSVEFSRITPDGRKLKGKQDFGYYLRTPADPKNPVWALGGYSQAGGTEISITKADRGYVVMNCRW